MPVVFVCECSCRCGSCYKEDCDCECHDLTGSTSDLREYVRHKRFELPGDSNSNYKRLSRNQIFGLFSTTDDPERTLAQAERFCKAIENSRLKQDSRSAIGKKKKQTDCDDDV